MKSRTSGKGLGVAEFSQLVSVAQEKKSRETKRGLVCRVRGTVMCVERDGRRPDDWMAR